MTIPASPQVHPSPPKSSSLKGFKRPAALLASGIIVLAVFYLGYRPIPAGTYQNRDDALITFSHAVNLADFGSIGINPSGERVEGFSTPLQFWIYYALYKTFGITSPTYTLLQTFVTAFLLGLIFMMFFETHPGLGLLLSLGFSVILVRDPSFFLWHGSGMENSLVHAMFLLSVLLLFQMVRKRKIVHAYSFPIFLASISRVESIYYILPLLLIFAVYWKKHEKNGKGYSVALIVLGLWGFFNLFRFLYFGDIFPNTASAHDISVFRRAAALIRMQSDVWIRSLDFAKAVFSRHLGYLIPLAIPLFFAIKKTRETIFLCTLLICFIALSLAYPFVFGPSSLDITRTSTHLSLLVLLFLGNMICSLKWKKAAVPALGAFFAAGWLVTGAVGTKPYYLPYGTGFFSQVSEKFHALGKEHQLFRPTVANPDLGLMSLQKTFNIIDIGKKGSPVLSRLDLEQSVADYLFDFAAPDFIEIHDAWSCLYPYVFSDSRFLSRYQPIQHARTKWLDKHCAHAPQVESGIWIRKDIMLDSPSAERRLIDRLAEDPSIEWIRKELNICSRSHDPSAHLYVTRTAYRFLPEFRKAKQADELIDLFRNAGGSAYDLSVLQSWRRGGWHRSVISYLRSYSLQYIHRKFQETRRLDVKDIPVKSGFYSDDIWTRGRAVIEDLDYQIHLDDTLLILKTYGFRPPHLRDYAVLKPRVYLNGKELAFSHMENAAYAFRLASGMGNIARIQIVSTTFVPRKEGINLDDRKLGLDLFAVEIR